MMTPLDLEAGVKFETGKKFAGHDFVSVVFTFGSLRTNNKGDIRTFKF